MSLLALTKILNHAQSGDKKEVMGTLFGRSDQNSIIIFDVLLLSVEGTETRVNAGNESLEFRAN